MATVLIADDESTVVELVTAYLHKDGHYVRTAFDGTSCLRLARDVHPDLIIMDVMMPGGGGFGACNKLLESEDTRKIPVIMLTAQTKMKDTFMMQTNVVAYVEKPFDPDSLARLVNKTLQSRAK
jgi:CheY-like chemotaxis protein